jgi:hypothetical protein
MSLGPQWCLGVLFGCFLPGQAPRARPGAFGTDLKAARQARTGDDGLGGRGNATHPSHVGFVADPSVLQDAKQHFGRALSAAVFLAYVVAGSHLTARDHTFRLRRRLPRKKRLESRNAL